MVDVEAIRFDANGEDLRAEFPEGFGRCAIAGTIGAINDNAQPLQRQVAWQRALGKFDVARPHVIDATRPAQQARRRQLRPEIGIEKLFDFSLDLVGEFEAVGAKQLDAIVGVRIVRGRDHHADIRAHGARQHGHRRRRHRAEQQNIHAHRGEAADHGIFNHVARQARVLADDHAMAMVAALEGEPGRLPHLHGEFRRDQAIGLTANAVGAKIFTSHRAVPAGLAHQWPQEPKGSAGVKSLQLLDQFPEHPRIGLTWGRHEQDQTAREASCAFITTPIVARPAPCSA